MCEFIVKTLEDFVTTNSTEAEIIDAVKTVCYILPGSIRTSCLDFVAQNGHALIELLIQQVPPHQVCLTLGMCDSRKSVPLFNSF